jgi:hypothetical protein
MELTTSLELTNDTKASLLMGIEKERVCSLLHLAMCTRANSKLTKSMASEF